MDFVNGVVRAKDIIYPVDKYESLYFIPTGNTQNDPSELLESDNLPILMEYLESEFDYIIIDSPPVALVSDAYKLSQYCAATVYVVRHGYTPKVIVKRFDANNEIHPLNTPVMVFNGVKKRGFANTESGYGYGYRYDSNSYYNNTNNA